MASDWESMQEQHDLTSEGLYQGKRPFGNYDLIRRIDMGGMGEVYLAHQRTAFLREVAVKIIRDDLSRDPHARARFFREAEVSSHLKHDHILPLFEFGEVEGRLFLVTPYISGGTLAQRLHAGPLSLGETRQLFSALVQAVAYIHRRGIVHRDLKPSNILLDDEEASGQVYVRLIDFGIAAKQGEMANAPLTPPGQEIGTLAYMAPERLDGIAAPSNDIYSLGVILYQMLTRHLPAEGIIVSGSLPASLEAVVRRCMAANPEDRYASAIDILPAFEQSCQALQVSAAPTASQSTLFPFPSVVLSQPIFAENVPGAHTPGETGDLLSSQPEEGETFGEADYAAPTINIAYAREEVDAADVVSPAEKQSLAVAAADISVSAGKKLARRGQQPLFAVVSLLIIVVLFVIAALVYLAFPLVVSATGTIGPQVHMLQQVYTSTSQIKIISI